MIYLTGNVCGQRWRERFAETPELGMMLNSDGGWVKPWSPHWSLDNGVFAHSPIGTKPDPTWWTREGESLWLKTLDKAAAIPHAPLFVVLPDVVMNWPATIRQAWCYRNTVQRRGLKPAIALQNGFDWREVERFKPEAVFVGGDTAFKFGRLPEIVAWARPRGVWVHGGRVNGWRRIH